MDEQNEKLNDDKVLLMAVAFSPDKNMYSVDIAQGSNVAETAFAMSIVIKCLIKDGIIEDGKVMTDLIVKYLNDPQYDELKEDNE